MNAAFSINLVALFMVPYSTLSTGLIVWPTKDPSQATLGFMVSRPTDTLAFWGLMIWTATN